MARAKKLDHIDYEVVEILAALVADRGFSYRKLRDLTGLSLNRIGIILRAETPPSTVGEISLIAEALGVRGSDVIEMAERRAFARSPETYDLAALRPGYTVRDEQDS